MSQDVNAVCLMQEVQVSSADVLPSHTRTVSLGRPLAAPPSAASFGGTTWIRTHGQDGTRFVSWCAFLAARSPPPSPARPAPAPPLLPPWRDFRSILIPN